MPLVLGLYPAEKIVITTPEGRVITIRKSLGTKKISIEADKDVSIVRESDDKFLNCKKKGISKNV